MATSPLHKGVPKRVLSMGFDIESAGSRGPIIGIGASVVNEDFKEVGSLFLPGYYPLQTKIEPRCWKQFWSKFPKQLSALEYKGAMDPKERLVDMVMRFQSFRAQWETYCKENNLVLRLVSDNPVFDGGFINDVIFEL